MRTLLLAILLACTTGLAMADTVQLKDGHPQSYTVKKGDTLWDISNLFLSDPWLWPDIWYLNPQIDNPHLIYPGDELSLVQVGDEQKVTVVERAPVKVKASDDMKLLPQVRTNPIETAIPAIPLEKINAFLSKTRIVSVEELDAAPYVLAGENRRIITGAGDQIYARGDFDPEHKIMGIYRAGETYVDPETKELLGFQARSIGSTRVATLTGDIATLVVNRSSEEIRINDRLLPSEEANVVSTFYPKAPAGKINGLIIGVEGAVRNAGNMSVVVLNVGERDGLEVGDILSIAQTGEVVRDRVKNQLVQLPDVRAGLLIVFRNFEKMSLALVLRSSTVVTIGDKVRNP
ncbi:MAG TPA: LysM domain-containing protein [Pseudomonadales bacterium]